MTLKKGNDKLYKVLWDFGKWRSKMNFFVEIANNYILMASVLGWTAAQILKTVIHLLVNKKFQAERLVGSGGMPSSHSATVCALSTATALECGVQSSDFAIAIILAIVVMYDAMGVRRETGKQAMVINDLLIAFADMGRTDLKADEKLKELVGHTPLQVLAGAILGIGIAVGMHI